MESFIINPTTNEYISIYSKNGREILKQYLIHYNSYGGGQKHCSLCKSPNCTKATCPLNTALPIINGVRGNPKKHINVRKVKKKVKVVKIVKKKPIVEPSENVPTVLWDGQQTDNVYDCRPHIWVEIANSDPKLAKKIKPLRRKALIDTGATGSAIPKSDADKLHLKSTSKMVVACGSGDCIRDKTKAKIRILPFKKMNPSKNPKTHVIKPTIRTIRKHPLLGMGFIMDTKIDLNTGRPSKCLKKTLAKSKIKKKSSTHSFIKRAAAASAAKRADKKI